MINIPIPSGKLKSPWMGVPVPGERPLILSTALVQAALRGVTVSDAEVTEAQRAGAGTEQGNRQSTRSRLPPRKG